jgi:hypothetical protein
MVLQTLSANPSSQPLCLIKVGWAKILAEAHQVILSRSSLLILEEKMDWKIHGTLTERCKNRSR